MSTTKVPKFSTPLVVLGAILLIIALGAGGVGAALGLAGLLSGASATGSAASRQKAETASALRKIPVEETVVDEFFERGAISEHTLSRLDSEERQKVETVMRLH